MIREETNSVGVNAKRSNKVALVRRIAFFLKSGGLINLLLQGAYLPIRILLSLNAFGLRRYETP